MNHSAGRDMPTSVKGGTWVSGVPVTSERPPFVPKEGDKLWNPGTARAAIAADEANPDGTLKNDWAKQHQDKTVMQQHLLFFDRDNDGVIWPTDTFVGFRRLGFNFIICALALIIIHTFFSYPTVKGWLPDPFARVYIARIHKDKHGSDTGAYDNEGRFIPQKFEDVFAKYAKGKDGINLQDVFDMLSGQRLLLDPVGTGAALFEWIPTYIMLWPEDGVMKKEDVRGVFDGSIFFAIAARREGRQKGSR